MKRILFAGVILLATVVVGRSSAFAESRPIKQLPSDVARLSTLWLTVPVSMIETGQEYGPLAALTWGPAKGTVEFARATKKEVWDSVKPDQKRGYRSRTQREIGPVFRYEF